MLMQQIFPITVPGRLAKRRLVSQSLWLVLFCCTVALPALAARRERLIDSWKPLNYDVTLVFNEQLSELTSARVAITIQTVKDASLIDLDFGDLTVDSVTVNGAATPFSRVPGLLNVKLKTPLPRDTRAVVVVSYHGVPHDGLVLSKDKAGKPSAIGD